MFQVKYIVRTVELIRLQIFSFRHTMDSVVCHNTKFQSLRKQTPTTIIVLMKFVLDLKMVKIVDVIGKQLAMGL